MIYLTIILFALSAVLGLMILVKWLTKKEASRAVVYSHGIVAALGLGCLIAYAIFNPESFPKASIVLFSVAAVAGFYMFFNDLAKKPSPMAVAFLHALVAVAGFLTLLFFVFT
jgi:hypothetical protein